MNKIIFKKSKAGEIAATIAIFSLGVMILGAFLGKQSGNTSLFPRAASNNEIQRSLFPPPPLLPRVLSVPKQMALSKPYSSTGKNQPLVIVTPPPGVTLPPEGAFFYELPTTCGGAFYLKTCPKAVKLQLFAKDDQGKEIILDLSEGMPKLLSVNGAGMAVTWDPRYELGIKNVRIDGNASPITDVGKDRI